MNELANKRRKQPKQRLSRLSGGFHLLNAFPKRHGRRYTKSNHSRRDIKKLNLKAYYMPILTAIRIQKTLFTYILNKEKGVRIE